MSRPIDKRQVAFELSEQMQDALPGIAGQAVEIMMTEGVDIVDGVSIGIRAGKMAEAMARANTARRVRDIDGYRRALRTAGAYIMAALLEIGEPIILPPSYAGNEWEFRNSARVGLRFRETEAYRAIMAERQAEREAEPVEMHRTLAAGTGDEIEDEQAAQLQRFRNVIEEIAQLAPSIGTIEDDDVKNCPIPPEGYPDVICDKGAGHPGPCHPLNTSVRTWAPHVRTDYPGAIPHNDPSDEGRDDGA